MILYFDSPYIAKCYLPEPGAEKVRELARSSSGLYSSALSVAELACVFHRQLRDAAAPPDSIAALRKQFRTDVRDQIWSLIPTTDRLLQQVDAVVRMLPPACLIRAGDAIHLATAMDAGFDEIWTNDRRLLAAAEQVGIRGRQVDE